MSSILRKSAFRFKLVCMKQLKKKKAQIKKIHKKIVAKATDKTLFIYKQEFYVTLFLIVVILAAVALATMKKVPEATRPKSDLPAGQEIRGGTQGIKVIITDPAAEKKEEEEEVAAAEPAPTPASPSGPSRIQFAIAKFRFLATQPLKFNVFDNAGKELTPDFLRTVNESKLHYIQVSADLREYHNRNPEYKSGVWNVPVYMPAVGNYYVYVEMTPVIGEHVVLKQDLEVRQPSSGELNYPSQNATVDVSGYTGEMQMEKGKGHGNRTLTVHLTKNENPVPNHIPFKGEFGHMTIFKHNDSNTYMNLYPVKVDDSLSWLKFNATFTVSGRYTVFVDANLGGQVVTFPFTFDVQL